MASKDQVLAHIETSEFLRQASRLIAQQTLSNLDLNQALLDDQYLPDQLDNALAKVHEDLAQKVHDESKRWVALLGLVPLTPQEEDDLTTSTLTDIQNSATFSLQDEIESIHSQVNRMLDEGMSEDSIKSVLDSSSGSSALMSGVKAILVGAAAAYISSLERGASASALAGSGEDALFRWNTVGDSDVCDSCDPRDGEENTISDWHSIGMPGSAGLICSLYSKSGSSNCRCYLESSDQPNVDPGKLDASEAIDAGAARAQDEYGD